MKVHHAVPDTAIEYVLYLAFVPDTICFLKLNFLKVKIMKKYYFNIKIIKLIVFFIIFHNLSN